ncbi:MAG TPA: hypothetical protein DCF63_08475 [Planctomycetaceae bacterium]|nr:hypothetical protein [Planctomycetaceae bacterium]
MGLAIAALIVFAILDFATMLSISRMPQLDRFTVGECITVPLAIFFLSGIALRAVGFAAAPWPILVVSYTLAAIMMFVIIAIRKNGFEHWSHTVKKSLISATLFSAIHFFVSALIGFAILS